ncbi:hypothetical protein [Burkholderia thailandensis]|uniref:hypothetical protein n=1 Tax=Burkholderia thailandensis TaxID=57975 RepID=UPI0002F4817F|nr:hypothetical protein [Burkholderia thailandensis]AOJ47779.1 hypothetical protein WJ27_21725 [Burkholderia thailandensis]KVG20739.1 hypothetical protein WJ28_03540 [Burkholderia thailandensis]
MRRECGMRRARRPGIAGLALMLALVWPGRAAQAAQAAQAVQAVQAAQAAQADDLAAHGRALFAGAAPMQGRLSMHPRDLPATVVRCANCHAAGASAAAANSIAPRLTRTWLADLQSRRGGPPSRYDRDAFCALLRTGLDPTYVMINVEMPRYRVSERDCAALWAFLNEVPHVRR